MVEDALENLHSGMWVKISIERLLDGLFDHDLLIIAVFCHILEDSQQTESLIQVVRKSGCNVTDQVGPDLVHMDAQVGHGCAEHVYDEARCNLAIAEVGRAIVAYNLHQVLAQFQLNRLHLTRVLLHSKRHKIEHRLVFEDRRGLENGLLRQILSVLENFKDYRPCLVRLWKLD